MGMWPREGWTTWETQGTGSVQTCSAPGLLVSRTCVSLCGEGISKIMCSKSSTQWPSGMLGSRYHLVKQRQGHRCRRLDSDIKQTQEMVEKKATERERSSRELLSHPGSGAACRGEYH